MAQKPLNHSKIVVLVIEDDEDYWVWVQRKLEEANTPFQLEWKTNLAAGIDYLNHHTVDIVLLDLFLPDSRGLEGFKRLKTSFKEMPIVIMSSNDDEILAMEAVQNGAEDYLIKGQVQGGRLARVLKYAIHRQNLRREVSAAGIKDMLTGLFNRDGFFIMAEQQMKLSKREKKGFSACFFVLNNYNEIMQMHGAHEGEYALLSVAEILKECFRDSDIIGRIGKDEFAVLIYEESFPKMIAKRIRDNQKFYNTQFNQYKLFLSTSLCHIDPSHPEPMRELAVKADQLLSAHKNKEIQEDFVFSG